MTAFWRFVTVLQFVLGLRVIGRLLRTAGGVTIQPVSTAKQPPAQKVTVLVPVLNEAKRLTPCLEGLLAESAAVSEIIVIDGGSHDGTQALVKTFAARDERLRLLEAGPPPDGLNGKAFNLKAGLAVADPDAAWIVTIDADVRPQHGLIPAMIAHAATEGLRALSVATRQQLHGAGSGLVHPAMLTTLVYRYGIPGIATRNTLAVQANGQCMLIEAELLAAVGGFSKILDSICEDVTLARLITLAGEPVGFYEAGDLVETEMYASGAETWRNWSRSLPMQDRFSGLSTVVGLAEVTLVQAAPMWLGHLARRRFGPRHPVTVLNMVLLATRAGILFGTARAYRQRPWSYWLSPMLDLPIAGQLWWSAARKRHSWRGTTLTRGGL